MKIENIFLMGVIMAILNFSSLGHAKTLSIGEDAPLFKAQTQDGKEFDLSKRKDQGWTVLYFFPKADTPGCTTQACAFRDAIKVIRDQNAEIYGISKNTIEDQNAFHKKYHLNFDLIADHDAKIIDLYDVKVPLIGLAKRWTFILDPHLKISWIEQNVDPAKDAQVVAAKIKELKENYKSSSIRSEY